MAGRPWTIADSRTSARFRAEEAGVELKGFEQCAAAMAAVPEAVARKVTRGAMIAAAKPLVAAARANARRHHNPRGDYITLLDPRTGKERRVKITKRLRSAHLFESAGYRPRVYRSDGVVYVAVGYVYAKGGYHAHLVEFGHRMVVGGSIGRTDGRRAPKTKNPNLRGMGTHVGNVPAYPILAPAWSDTKNQCFEALVDGHRRMLLKVAEETAREHGVIA